MEFLTTIPVEKLLLLCWNHSSLCDLSGVTLLCTVLSPSVVVHIEGTLSGSLVYAVFACVVISLPLGGGGGGGNEINKNNKNNNNNDQKKKKKTVYKLTGLSGDTKEDNPAEIVIRATDAEDGTE